MTFAYNPSRHYLEGTYTTMVYVHGTQGDLQRAIE